MLLRFGFLLQALLNRKVSANTTDFSTCGWVLSHLSFQLQIGQDISTLRRKNQNPLLYDCRGFPPLNIHEASLLPNLL